MFNKLALIHGEAVIPEGYAAVYGKRFSDTTAQINFLTHLETDYYFLLRFVRARYERLEGVEPAIEIFRDAGSRAMQQGALGVNAIPLDTLTTPGEIPFGGSVKVLKPAVPLNMWFTPGSVLQILCKPDRPTSEGGTIDIVAHGRYYLKPVGL